MNEMRRSFAAYPLRAAIRRERSLLPAIRAQW